jgi:3'(2'), 5'-bisphosphate nucleotidase
MKLDPLNIVRIANEASNLVMRYYNSSESVEMEHKSDNSPVTIADHKSSMLIVERLYELDPSIPVVSEEGKKCENIDIIRSSDIFWLIDPIDGTWSFIKRSGIFVINIALIEYGEPTFGIISYPITGTTYYSHDNCAYKIQHSTPEQVHPNRNFNGGLDILVSDSNLNQRTQDFINRYEVKTLTPIPSAYKFALMAEGKGDIYPRFKPTYTWDTASGHAILKACGGEIYGPNVQPLKYNDGLLNPDFVAVADASIKVASFNN